MKLVGASRWLCFSAYTVPALGRPLLITNSLLTGLEITSAQKISKGEANQITH